MSKFSTTVEYNIKTNLDASGLQKLQAQLTTVNNALQSKKTRGILDEKEVQKSITAVKELQSILNKSFNAKLGTLNLSELNNKLRTSKTLVSELNNAFKQTGAVGATAANTLTARLFKMDTGLKSVSKATDKIVNTIGNTFRWGVIASGFASIMNAVHDAAKYTTELDKSLTNIMMVSGESRDNMNEFAKAANAAAQKMGSTTTAMTNATTIFVQQGLDLETSSKLAEYSVHLANVSGQDSAEAADEITAYKNAFKIDVADVENAISKWAAVANNAAVSVEELSVASQKAASVAKTVGVDMDQFAGHITAIEATTREAPENIGNGLKTLYSRISDIKLGEELEDGVDLGQFTAALKKVGVDALDASGQLRDAGTIIEDLMSRWGELSQTEQVATATTVAGRFQLARFMALMNSADIYKGVVDVSRAETGTETYDRMQETFRDSMEGRMNALRASVEEIFNNLFTTDSMYPLIEGLNTLVDVFNELVQSVGGGSNALSAFSLLFGQIFSTQISRAVNNFTQNRQLAKNQQNQYNTIRDISMEILNGRGVQIGPEQTKVLGRTLAGVGQYANIMTQEEFQAFGKNAQQLASSMNVAAGAVQKAGELTDNFSNSLSKVAGITEIDTSNMEKMVDAATMAQEVIHRITQESQKMWQSLKGTPESGEGRFGTGLYGLQGIAGRQLSTLSGSTGKGYNDEFKQIYKGMRKDWDSFKTTDTIKTILSEADIDLIENKLNSLKRTTLGTVDGAKDFVRIVNELAQSLKPLAAAAGRDTVAFDNFATEIFRLRDEMEAANIEAHQMQDALEGTSERLANQSRVQNIMNLAMSIGQLGFAMQSFKSLGSTLLNPDIGGIDKLVDTIANLGFTLPMIMYAFDTFKETTVFANISKQINTVKKAQSELKAAKLASAAATEVEIAAEVNLNAMRTASVTSQANVIALERNLRTASDEAAAARFREAQAEKALAAARKTAFSGAAVLGITTAAMAGIAAFTAYLDAQKEAYKQSVEQSKEIIEQQKEIGDQVKTFEDLYEKYKKTGEVTDELKSSTEGLLNTFGLQNEQVLTSINNYDALAESIEKASKEQRKLAEGQLETTLWGQQSGMRGSGEAASFLNLIPGTNGMYGSVFETLSGGMNVNSSEYAQLKEAFQNNNFGEAIALARQNLENLQQRQQEQNEVAKDLKNKIDQGQTELQTAYDSAKEQMTITANSITLAQNALSNEKVTNWLDTISALAEYAALDMDKLSEKDAGDYQTVVDQFFKNEWIAQYLEQLGSWSDQLSWMISQTTDEVQKRTLQLQQSKENFGQNAYNKVNDAVTAVGLDTTSMGFENQGQYVDQVVSGMMNQVENSGLTTDEKIRFMATIDWNKSLPEIQAELEELKNTDSLPKLTFEPTLTDRSTFSQTEVDDLLKDTGMTEGGLNAMSQDIFSSAGIQETAEKIKTSIREVQDSIDSGSQSAEEGAQDIANLRQKYEDLGKTSKDIATYNLQMNKGIANLVKNWKDYAEVLEKDVDKGTSDYYQTLGELDEIMSDILNIDTGVLSKGFYENADAIEAMGRAAEGDVTAIDDLRRIASEDIIMNLKINDISEEDYNYLLNQELLPMMQNLQSNLPNLEIGADLSTDPFIAKLNDLLAKSQITAEQATNILSSMGVEANVLHKHVEGTSRTTMHLPSYHVEANDGQVRFVPDGTTPVEVEESIASDIPYIEGAAYTGPGFSTVGAASSGNTGGSGGGGGGGGGGSKAKEPSKVSHTKTADSEKDIYNKLNAQLEKLQDNYKQINRLRENAAGSKYRKYINEEIANLEAQNANLAKRNKLTKEYLKALRDNKANPELNVKQTDTLGLYGLKDKNKDGVVDNYDSVIDAARKKAFDAQQTADDYFKAHGGAFDVYGNTTQEASMNEDESEQYKKLTEAAANQAERVNLITDAANKYQDAWNDVRDTLDQIDENLQSIIDKQVELFNRAVDAAQSLQEVNRSAAKLKAFGTKNGFGDWTSSDSPFRAMVEDGKLLEGTYDGLIKKSDAFYDKMIKKAKKSNDKASLQFWRDQKKSVKDALGNGTSAIDLAQNQLEFLLSDKGKAQFSAKDKATGRSLFDKNAWLEAVKEVKSNLEDAIYNGEELVEKLASDIVDAYGKIDEYMNDHFDKYQQWLDRLEYRNKLIELTYGESNLDAIGDNLESQNSTLENMIKDENTYHKKLRKQEQKRWEDYQKNGTETSYNLWKEVHDLAETQSDKIEELVVQRIETIQAIAKNNIEKAKRAMDQAFYGTAEDPFVQSWELAKERAEAYKDEVEAGYEIDKLHNRFQKLLDNAGTLKTQKQIKQAMQEQLDFLNAQVDAEHHKVTMSQFDVDLANAKIALLEKQIALEDAQRNKNQMQLRRDSQGNYNYVYTANDEDVDDKEQEVLDAGYDIYEMSKQEVQRINEEAVRMYQDAQNRIAAIQENTVLDATQKEAMVAEILDNLQKRFAEMGVDLQDAIQGTIDGATILYKYGADDTKTYYEEMANATKETWNKAAKDVGICFSDVVHDVLKGNEDFKTSAENMKTTFNTQIEAMQQAAEKVTKKISGDFAGTTKSVNDTTTAITGLKDEMTELNKAMNDDLGAIDTASNRLNQYTAQLNNTKDSASKLRQALNEANAKIAQLEADKLDYSTRLNNVKAGRDEYDNGDKGKGKGGNSNGGNLGSLAPGTIATLKAGHKYYYSSYGSAPTGDYNAGIKDGVIVQDYSGTQIGGYQEAGDWYVAIHGSGLNGANTWQLGWVKPEDLEGYDTGGYTGNWGTDGKLAMLHEKELVLNQQDTANMLAAIDLVRQIIDTIKTPNFSSSLGNWTASKSGDTIEQRVEVTAEFPNVIDSNEIEAALISLADNAYQYAYRS